MMFLWKRGPLMGKGDSGGGGGSSQPAAPDPTVTAKAQQGQDINTAMANSALMNPTINSPYGTVAYNQNTMDTSNANPASVTRPTQTITLAPAEQKQLDQRNAILNQLNTKGLSAASQFPNNPIVQPTTPALPTNIDYRNVNPVGNMNDYQAQANQASQAYYNQAYNLMQPAMNLQQNKLQDQLVQQGNPMGTPAYQTQNDLFNQTYNNQLQNLADQAIVQGYNVQNQLFNNANTQRQNQVSMDQLPYQTALTLQNNNLSQQSAIQNQNINALSALLNGQAAIQNPSIQLPGTTGYQQAAMSSPNLTSIANNNYNQQMASYNQQQAQQNNQSNGFTSGIFSLGSALMSFL